jgi:hypothetical protein
MPICSPHRCRAAKGNAAGRRARANACPSEARLIRGDTKWQAVTLADWYGEGERHVEIASDTAVWYHGGLPVVPLRWVLARDPAGQFRPQAFLCTDEGAEPAQILRWFVSRWRLEVTFEETRRPTWGSNPSDSGPTRRLDEPHRR